MEAGAENCGKILIMLLQCHGGPGLYITSDVYITFQFLQHAAMRVPQCSHCKRFSSYSNSVCLSVCLSHAGIVSKQLHVMVQFALSDSKMCLVL